MASVMFNNVVKKRKHEDNISQPLKKKDEKTTINENKKKKVSKVVEKKEKKEEEEEKPFTNYFETVNYFRKGEYTQLSDPINKAYKYIEEHCLIPCDFDTNHKFGPHSGTYHEERLINAYNQKLIQPKDNKGKYMKMCIECGETGHLSRTCPSLI